MIGDRVRQTGGHGNLSREVEHDGSGLNRLLNRRTIANVCLKKAQPLTETLLKPLKVAFGACPTQII